MSTALLLSILLPACGPGLTSEQAADAVQQAAAKANPGPGRFGMELLGKSRWVKGQMFEAECVQRKDLAFVDDPKKSETLRISPTWQSQRWITADTPGGWCVLLGEDLQVEVGPPSVEQDAWIVPVTYKFAKPSPWYECLNDRTIRTTVRVSKDEAGQPAVDGELAFLPSACPHPMPPGEERAGKKDAPRKDAPKPPTREDVLKLMKAFDDDLWERDRVAALEHVACYNLYDDKKFGSCTPAELIQVGPHPRAEDRPGDGVAWTEGVIKDFDDIESIRKEPKIPGMYHVTMTHKRSKRDRSFAVQWVGGEWKLVGVVGALGADLTSLRFLYDLHKSDKRDVFLRRLEGEEIDERGEKLDPYAEETEE
ncbi:MAG: hypothetical protein H6739_37360 [Alphaproteobacteria bacterium]|nr:hypothetical protein [Alphaproteobacteria bacterium]